MNIDNELVVVDVKNFDGVAYTSLDKDMKCIFSGKPAKEFEDEGYTIMTRKELKPLLDDYYNSICNKWEEITEEAYNYMLNILPPMHWTNGGFYMVERYTGDVTGFYQEWNGKYYTSLQRLSTDRTKVIESLKAFIKNKN